MQIVVSICSLFLPITILTSYGAVAVRPVNDLDPVADSYRENDQHGSMVSSSHTAQAHKVSTLKNHAAEEGGRKLPAEPAHAEHDKRSESQSANASNRQKTGTEVKRSTNNRRNNSKRSRKKKLTQWSDELLHRLPPARPPPGYSPQRHEKEPKPALKSRVTPEDGLALLTTEWLQDPTLVVKSHPKVIVLAAVLGLVALVAVGAVVAVITDAALASLRGHSAPETDSSEDDKLRKTNDALIFR